MTICQMCGEHAEDIQTHLAEHHQFKRPVLPVGVAFEAAFARKPSLADLERIISGESFESVGGRSWGRASKG